MFEFSESSIFLQYLEFFIFAEFLELVEFSEFLKNSKVLLEFSENGEMDPLEILIYSYTEF